MNSQTLFQHGTLGALMAGLFEGTLTIEELLTHGNLGIGTLNDLDGELIILNGQAFQAKADGTVTALTGAEMVPYAAVTSFASQSEISFSE
ncbi:acetolactate decarboxylase, partial [Carnobacterium sp.]|uniref:acetolactate decarboxylase n=1 Tax=Carnobacterium sp. TaxID=48221 RepID=UPI0028A97E0C